jgi:hypothetical protein
MKAKRLDILVLVVAALTLMNCSKNELLSSFEEEQEQSMSSLPLPLQFTPYVGNRTEATTRADLNYLSNIETMSDKSNGKWVFNSFPWYRSDPDYPNDPDKGTGSARGARINYPFDFRFGKLGNNSYIVGVYGYYGLNNDEPMLWNTMTDIANISSLTSNFMTNQPLLHVDSLTWTYSPLKYWPNSTNNNNVKVTFVSYYPFQDYPESGRGYNPTTGVTGYYRDGKNANGVEDDRYVDFSDCIVPPAKGATGEDAYTFTFTQKDNLEEQIDFLLGINQNVTKQKVNGNPSIDLNLKHTMCSVLFDLRAPAFSLPANTEVYYYINSISLEGLYNKGKVYPVVNGDSFDIQWKELEGNANYTLTFDDPDNFHGKFTRPSFTGTKQQRYRRQLIYENSGTKAENIDITESDTKKLSNSRGMKYLMLVIPQKVDVSSDGITPKKAYLVVNYDIKYVYSDGVTNIFKDNEERILLKDNEKHDNKGQLFIAGKFLTFNIRFLGPKQITMDAVLTDWDEGEGPEEEGGNGVPVPHEWEDRLDSEEQAAAAEEEEEGGTP